MSRTLIERIKDHVRSSHLQKEFGLKPGRFFYEHAYFLLNHFNKIFNDPKMFYAEVPISSQIGVNKRGTPYLGVMTHFWLSTASLLDRGNQLIILILGSPLSHGKSCISVDVYGKLHKAENQNCTELWEQFMKLYAVFEERKPQIEPYDLETVYKILTKDEKDIYSYH